MEFLVPCSYQREYTIIAFNGIREERNTNQILKNRFEIPHARIEDITMINPINRALPIREPIDKSCPKLKINPPTFNVSLIMLNITLTIVEQIQQSMREIIEISNVTTDGMNLEISK